MDLSETKPSWFTRQFHVNLRAGRGRNRRTQIQVVGFHAEL
jgi:hypothetical protein